MLIEAIYVAGYAAIGVFGILFLMNAFVFFARISGRHEMAERLIKFIAPVVALFRIGNYRRSHSQRVPQ